MDTQQRAATMALMAKKRSEDPEKTSQYPSRKNTRYVGIPKVLDDLLKEAGAKVDRSKAYMAKIAIREYLERNGYLPPKQPKKES